MTIQIQSLDHWVLTVADVKRTIDFYSMVLGMRAESFGDNRWALKFGNQKINLHQKGHEFEPKAKYPTPGSADLCFLVTTPIDEIVRYFETIQIPIEDGPIKRTGAQTLLLSVYIRDPDQNLIELSNPLSD